jgi:hypothetical protein
MYLIDDDTDEEEDVGGSAQLPRHGGRAERGGG